MDSRDEELTLENVDELVAQALAESPASQPSTSTSLSRTARNLQIIYEEQRRLECVWERINERASALGLTAPFASREENEAPTSQPWPVPDSTVYEAPTLQVLPVPEKAVEETGMLLNGHRRSPLDSSRPRTWPSRRRRWHKLSMSLVAALFLVTLFATFFAWPLLAPHFRGVQSGGSRTPTQMASPQSPLVMREYIGRYFTLQYPANWVITGVSSETTAAYVQTVQFRPSPTSAVEIDVSMMPNSHLSTYQLLSIDPQVKTGTLSNTRTVTYHRVPWIVGIVDQAHSSPSQVSKLEIAYSKQINPYRVEFAATSDTFAQYAPVFDTMLASLYPQARPVLTPTPTPTSAAPTTPTPTQVAPLMQVYIGRYFKIQYPANWAITSVTTGATSLQTVQFRPSATSSVFVNVEAMSTSTLSAGQLLDIDPAVSLGTLLNTSSVTYHGIPWSVGLVDLAGSLLTPASRLEVAYSNLHNPYKIELSAPPDVFTAYTSTFNNIFASFYPEASSS